MSKKRLDTFYLRLPKDEFVDYVRANVDSVNWNKISAKRSLPISFYKEHRNRIKWGIAMDVLDNENGRILFEMDFRNSFDALSRFATNVRHFDEDIVRYMYQQIKEITPEANKVSVSGTFVLTVLFTCGTTLPADILYEIVQNEGFEVNWQKLHDYQNIDERTIEHVIDQIGNINALITHGKVSEEFAMQYRDKIDWEYKNFLNVITFEHEELEMYRQLKKLTIN